MNVKVRCLSIPEANQYLERIDMNIGYLNQITASSNAADRDCIKYIAPNNVHELLCFSEHVAGWLPDGAWKIFQVDDLTSLTVKDAFILSKLLMGTDVPINIIKNPTFLLEFEKSYENNNMYAEFLIPNLIYFFLLFEANGQIVSSSSFDGQILSLEEGLVYFSSERGGGLQAKAILEKFEHNPKKGPDWVLEAMGSDGWQ